MPSQRPLPAPGHEPGASGFAGFLLALEGPDDQDLLLAGGPMRDVVLRWRGGRVAALEAGFDPVARLIWAGVAPDALAEALAGRPDGIDGLALLAWLVDAGAGHEGLVRAAATALAVEAAAELLTLPPERLEARPAPDAPATVPPAADLAIAPAALIEAATSRHEELARLAAVVPGPGAVARLTGGPGPSDAAVLARIDGRRTVTDLAAASGLTRFEVATALAALAGAGVIEIDAGAASWPTPWVAPPAPEPVADARAELAAFQAEQPAEPGPEPDQTPEPDQAHEPAPEPTPEPVEEPVPADVGAAWLALREVAAGVESAAPSGRPEPEPDPAPEPEPVAVARAEPEPLPAAPRDVDSSSLLRELASINLGEETEEPDGPDGPPPQRAAAGAGGAAGGDERGKGGRFGFRRGTRR